MQEDSKLRKQHKKQLLITFTVPNVTLCPNCYTTLIFTDAFIHSQHLSGVTSE